MHIGKLISCHAHTCIWKGTFMPSIYIEGQFHIIYSFGKHPHAIFDMGTFSKRLLMLPIPKYAYVERHFCYSFTLCKVFLCHIFTHFARYFRITYIHIYTYHWKVFSMPPRCKVFLMGQPNSSKNPLKHVLIFMPFHIQNQNLDS